MTNILYHPCFGSPKVENPVIRGRKRGCISFQAAYRAREAARRPASPDDIQQHMDSLKEISIRVDPGYMQEIVSAAHIALLRVQTLMQMNEMAKRGV